MKIKTVWDKYYPLYDGYCAIYHWLLLSFIMISVIYGFKTKKIDSAVMWKYVMQFVPIMFLVTIDTLVKMLNIHYNSQYYLV